MCKQVRQNNYLYEVVLIGSHVYGQGDYQRNTK